MKKRCFAGIIIISTLISAISTGCFTASEDVPQTNESLTVYCNDTIDLIMRTAIAIFKEEYPEVNVEVLKPQVNDRSEAADEELNTVIAKIMSGEGPDVLCTPSFFSRLNCEKLVLNGIPADMSSFYDADSEFFSDFDKKIMDGGIIDGKRYFFPINYSLPLLLSTQKTLDKYGLKAEDCPDALSFLEKTGAVMESGTKLTADFIGGRDILDCLGLKPIDVKSGTVDADLPGLEQAFDWLKKHAALYPEDGDLTFVGDKFQNVIDGESVFFPGLITSIIDYPQYIYYCKFLTAMGETPVLFPIRNVSGGLTATITNAAFVRANSPNKQNAYNLIKIILGEEVQSSDLSRSYDTFVSKKIMDDYFFNISKDGFFDSTGLPATDEQHEAHLAYINEVNDVVFQYWGVSVFREMQRNIYDGKPYAESIAQIKEKIEFELSE